MTQPTGLVETSLGTGETGQRRFTDDLGYSSTQQGQLETGVAEHQESPISSSTKWQKCTEVEMEHWRVYKPEVTVERQTVERCLG